LESWEPSQHLLLGIEKPILSSQNYTFFPKHRLMLQSQFLGPEVNWSQRAFCPAGCGRGNHQMRRWAGVSK